MTLAFNVRIGNKGGVVVFWHPLGCACWAFFHFPIVGEQLTEISHRPLGRCGRPGPFKARGDGVLRMPFATAVLPAKALAFGGFCSRFYAQTVVRFVGAMGFTEGVATGNECHSLFVIHRHTAEGLANIVGRKRRVWLTIWAFGVYIDQAHLHGSEGIVQFALAFVALVFQHDGFRAPVDQIGFPVVLTTAGETKGFEAHVFHGNGTG